MKKLFLPTLLFALALGASSCQKCADCDCPLVNLEFCVDDYDNKDEYDAAVDLAEDAGCSCTQKLAGS